MTSELVIVTDYGEHKVPAHVLSDIEGTKQTKRGVPDRRSTIGKRFANYAAKTIATNQLPAWESV